MKQDIETAADVVILVDTFYKKAIADEVIGHFFTSVVQLNFDAHMPVMYNFWQSVLLGTTGYSGNTMGIHLALDKKSPMQPHHFEQWLKLWTETVNDLFDGPIATTALARARNVAALMQHKVAQAHTEGSCYNIL